MKIRSLVLLPLLLVPGLGYILTRPPATTEQAVVISAPQLATKVEDSRWPHWEYVTMVYSGDLDPAEVAAAVEADADTREFEGQRPFSLYHDDVECSNGEPYDVTTLSQGDQISFALDSRPQRAYLLPTSAAARVVIDCG